MYLNDEEKAMFFRLYFDLLYCTNEKYGIVGDFASGRFPKSIDSSLAIFVRDELFANPEWIDEYKQEHGDELNEEERTVITQWRSYFVKDKFLVMKHLAKYSVFMAQEGEGSTKLYGITGITHAFAELIDKSWLPMMVDAVILPFKGKIIYDGLIHIYRITIGPTMRKNMNEEYKSSKEKYGIITSLPFDESKPRTVRKAPAKASPAKTATTTMAKNDVKILEISDSIVDFCNSEFTGEYAKEFADVCLYVLEKLRRKRPSPLLSGKANTWACGIAYAVCSNNFVFDRSQPYYMSAQDIASWFDLSKSTAQGKAAEINKMLKISYLNNEYVIDSIKGDINEVLDSMRAINQLLRGLF